MLMWLSSFHGKTGQCMNGELSVYIRAECMIKSELFRSYKIRHSFCVAGAENTELFLCEIKSDLLLFLSLFRHVIMDKLSFRK